MGKENKNYIYRCKYIQYLVKHIYMSSFQHSFLVQVHLVYDMPPKVYRVQ